MARALVTISRSLRFAVSICVKAVGKRSIAAHDKQFSALLVSERKFVRV